MSAAVTHRIGDLCEQIRGVTYSKADAVLSPRAGFKPVLRANNITERGLTFEDLVYVPAGRIAAKQFVRQNDVVVAASSGSIDVVGKAARAPGNFDGGFGAFCKVLRPNGKVDPGYFAHFFQTQGYRRRVSALAAGANINNLRNEHLDDLEVALPPLPEQRRIAAILDRADALRIKRRAALALIDGLSASYFEREFGSQPSDGLGVQLADVASLITKGTTPTTLGFPFVDTGVPFLRVQNLVRSRVNLEDSLFISEQTHHVLERSKVRPADVLISIAGTIGRTAIVADNMPEMNCNQAVALVRSGEELEPIFLLHWLGSRGAQTQIRAGQVTGTISNISLGLLRGLKINLPPLARQREFAARVRSIDAIKEAHGAALRHADALFQSLQRQAFSGAL